MQIQCIPGQMFSNGKSYDIRFPGNITNNARNLLKRHFSMRSIDHSAIRLRK